MASIMARGNTFRIAVSAGKDKNGNQIDVTWSDVDSAKQSNKKLKKGEIHYEK